MTPPDQDPIRHVQTGHDDPNPGATFPLPALTASIILHGLLMVALLHGPLPAPILEPDNGVITMRLLPRPKLEAEPPEPPIPSRSQTRREQREVPDTSEPERPPATVAETGPGSTHAVDEVDIEEKAEDPAKLRARILEQVGVLQTGDDPTGKEEELPWTRRGERTPGLPGTRGWISGYVGRVQPSAHTWKENDGSSRGRYVLADGTVVCTRRRAPTIDELMNPWKSTAVTMGSICGRERPTAPDFTDPRVQPPPASVQAGRGDRGSLDQPDSAHQVIDRDHVRMR